MKPENLHQKFEALYQRLSEPQKLLKSLGGEIPFFIVTYPPQQEEEVFQAIDKLQNRLIQNGLQILELNLFEICHEILYRELGPGQIFEDELDMDKHDFYQALQSVLSVEDVVMPELLHRIQQSDAQLYFLTGIGQVYPFLRTHNILNNFQSVGRNAPSIIFFPGSYNGLTLKLFDRLDDDNYYRASHIDV